MSQDPILDKLDEILEENDVHMIGEGAKEILGAALRALLAEVAIEAMLEASTYGEGHPDVEEDRAKIIKRYGVDLTDV